MVIEWEAQGQRLPEERCQEFSCPSFIVCIHGIGHLTPDRHQCSVCHRNVVVMLDRQRLTLSAGIPVHVGEVLRFGDDLMTVQSVLHHPDIHGTQVQEVLGFTSGHMRNQIEYDDNNQCDVGLPGYVKPNKLTRSCRSCMAPFVNVK